jgi:hypothetical protein
MMIEQKRNRPRVARWGWGILVALGAMLALNGVMLYFVIAETAQVQTASVLETGLGFLVLLVAWEGFRHGSHWAWRTTWVLVAVLAAVGLHIVINGETGVGFYYLGLAAIALLGQVLAGRGSGSAGR